MSFTVASLTVKAAVAAMSAMMPRWLAPGEDTDQIPDEAQSRRQPPVTLM
jgi:hypothetical protein